LFALALVLAGCGSGGGPAPEAPGLLTVYTDLPEYGPQNDEMKSIYEGEQLALYSCRRRGRIDLHCYSNEIGSHTVTLQEASDGSSSGWSPGDAEAAATNAVGSNGAIAMIGDFDSGATATSLPYTNSGDMLQVSPASPYIGLTDPSPYDDKGEPGSYYPAAGTQTFARLVPNDVQEARATVAYMRSVGVSSLFAITDTAPYASYDSVIATMVADDARRSGISVVGATEVNSSAPSLDTAWASLAQAIRTSGAQAVIVGAAPDAGIETLWEELFTQLPHVKLFAPSTLATNPFLNAIGNAAAATYVTSPILPLNLYGPQAQEVLRAYWTAWRIKPTAWSLYGYEAMESVLAAISRAAKHGHPGNRLAVVHAYFHLGYRESVLGGYTINAHGDTSRSRFVGYVVNPTASGFQLVRKRRYLNGGPP
jgi:branched-chain amino acid transport system substrate-binding protein